MKKKILDLVLISNAFILIYATMGSKITDYIIINIYLNSTKFEPKI